MTQPTTDSSTTLEPLGDPLRRLHAQFDALIEPERRALWRYCHYLTGSSWDAEDLVQETLLKAFARVAQLWQPVQPRAWLFRIASNTWIDRVRRERRVTFGDLDEVDEHCVQSGEQLGPDVHDAMRRLVRLLPPRQRVVYLLTQTMDFQANEVAAMLGTTTAAVKATLHRARETLRLNVDADPRRPESTATTTVTALRPVVARYVEAFNTRNPDAIAALLDDDAVTDIVGVAEEQGRSVTRSASLAEWAADPSHQWIEPGQLDGCDVLFVFYQTAVMSKALAGLVRLETSDSHIYRQWQYFYCPELIEHAAAQLGVPAMTHGYRYSAPV